MARLSSGSDFFKSTIAWLHENELYFQLSALSGIILIAGLVNDFLQYTILEQPLRTTQSFTYITLVIHVVSLLLSLQAFIYTTLRFKRESDRKSIFMMICNGFSLVLRVVLEMTLIDFRREYYTS